MIKYAWYKSGYIEQKPDSFETPSHFCFDCNMTDKDCLNCLKEGTQMLPFARCSHCENFYCFNHFFGIDSDLIDYHVYVEDNDLFLNHKQCNNSS